MVKRLLAYMQCQLALRQWEEKLQVALRLFWLGDFANADDLFSQLLRRIVPYLEILEATPRSQSPTPSRDPVVARLSALSAQIAFGRWAISYVQAQPAPLPHPPLPKDPATAERIRDFVVDMHLARADLSIQALDTYCDYVSGNGDAARCDRIAALANSATPSPTAYRLLRLLWATSPVYVEAGRLLCSWLLAEDRLPEARSLAEALCLHHPNDTVCSDLLAYVCERQQEWMAAFYAYRQSGNLLRAAFMAMLGEDDTSLSDTLAQVSEEDRHTPLGYLCEGWLCYRQGKVREAMDAWILAVSPGTEQELDIPLLTALRAFEDDPAGALVEIQNRAGSRLPATAITALTWIASQIARRPRRRRKSAKAEEPGAHETLRYLLLNTSPNDDDNPIYPFLKAVASSAGMAFLPDASAAERPVLLNWIDPPLRNQIEAIDYATEGRWFEALAILNDAEFTALHRRLASKALAESLSDKDWPSTHQLLDDWSPLLRAVVSVPQLEQRMHQELWEAGDFPLLVREMIRILLGVDVPPLPGEDSAAQYNDFGTLRTHHNAAIVSGQIAHNTGSVSGWKSAIAHWAVVLSDNQYWRNWYDLRRARYGPGADTLDATQLPERIAQQVSEFWQRGLSHEDRLHCLALLSWEWESALAMRHAFRQAAAAHVELPGAVIRTTSPTLIRHYAPDDAERFLSLLPSLEVTDDARTVIEAAFSSESEINALINAGHHDLALNLGRARGLPAEQLRPLQARAHQQMIEELLERGDLDGALHLAVNVYQEFEDGALGAAILLSTAYQWAAINIEQEQPTRVIQRIVEIQDRFPALRQEFRPLLAQSYAAEGQRRLALGDFDNALLEFLNALQYDDQSKNVRTQLSLIYHNRAVDALEESDLETALADASQAMRYLPDPETSTLLVDIHTRRAQLDVVWARWAEAQQNIQALLQHARNCDDVNFFTLCVSSLLSTFVNNRRFDQAMALLEGAARLPHNRAILDIEHALASLLARQMGGRRV